MDNDEQLKVALAAGFVVTFVAMLGYRQECMKMRKTIRVANMHSKALHTLATELIDDDIPNHLAIEKYNIDANFLNLIKDQ